MTRGIYFVHLQTQRARLRTRLWAAVDAVAEAAQASPFETRT